jgi:hypothetical protein
MLTLAALMQNTPNPVRKRAAGQCSGALTAKDQSFSDKLRGRKGAKFRELRFGVSCTDGLRSVSIRFYDGGKVDKKSLVWVTCSCPYWCYYCEVAVASTGSTQVIISNGQAPKVRNPSVTPYLCKHLYRCATMGLKTVLERGLDEGFFYEQGPRKKLRDKAEELQQQYVIPEDERQIPWAGDPTGKGSKAASIDWSKPTLINLPASLRKKLGGK